HLVIVLGRILINSCLFARKNSGTHGLPTQEGTYDFKEGPVALQGYKFIGCNFYRSQSHRGGRNVFPDMASIEIARAGLAEVEYAATNTSGLRRGCRMAGRLPSVGGTTGFH